MTKRESKTHFGDSSRGFPHTRCGTDGRINFNASGVTCRVCWYRMLTDVAPWAEGFLKELRGDGASERELSFNAGMRLGAELAKAPRSNGLFDPEQLARVAAELPKLTPIEIPRTLPEPMDGKIKGLGDRWTRAFNEQRRSQKAIGELLSQHPAANGAVQPVVHGGGPPADAVGVKERDVAEQPGDAGEISDEAYWGY